MSELGVKSIAWDDQGYEHRTEVVGIVECVVCGNDVEIESETMAWEEGEDGRWHHLDDGGLATGQCCGKLYADWWEGTHVYDMEAGK